MKLNYWDVSLGRKKVFNIYNLVEIKRIGC
jgi:hypothetical protein